MHRNDELERIAKHVFQCGLQLHRELGPGLLESVYEAVLFEELLQSGFRVDRQVPINIKFRGIEIANAFRADLIVEGKLLVELKSTENASPVHAKQVLTYLRLTGIPLGFLMNFGMDRFSDGFKRFGNGYFAEPQ